MDEVLVCQNIEKYYGNKGNVTKAIDGISFSIEAGEYVGIMGASGSGKTTLLNCVSTIDSVTAGHIYVDGKDITTLKSKKLSEFRREQLGFIFQDSNLLDTLTLRENIALALTISHVAAADIEPRVEMVARQLGITDALDRFPYQVSGGQRQRAAAARAIIADPALVLADEPTGALDSKNARLLLESLEVLNGRLNTTILMVTHDSFAASYANRILFIKDGRIFNEIRKGNKSRKQFFDEIIGVVSFLGGEAADVR